MNKAKIRAYIKRESVSVFARSYEWRARKEWENDRAYEPSDIAYEALCDAEEFEEQALDCFLDEKPKVP